MWERSEVSEVRERFADGGGEEARQPSPKRWFRVFAAFAALFVAAVAAGVVLSGCGNGGSQGHVSDSAPAVASEPEPQVPASSAAAAPAPAPQGGLSAQDRAVREGLPPDMSVAVGDTLVAPGGTAEFTVVGTEDVREVLLSDGRDEPLPFVRDAGTNVWRATYRMPLRPRHERFGVSVTARNDAERWRRAWVFLHVDRGDSTKTEEAPVDNPDELDDSGR